MNGILRSLLLAVLLLEGCAVNPSSPVELQAQQDVANSRTAGQVIGATAGGLLLNRSKLGGVAGAIIGGYIGGKIGESVGHVAANRRLKYATESDFIESEVKNSNRAIEAKRRDVQNLRREVNRTHEEIASLQSRHRRNQDVSAAAASKLAEVNEKVDRTQSELDGFRRAIDYLDEVIATSSRQKGSTAGLEGKRNQLIAKRDELQSSYKKMQGINSDYKKEREQLQPLARSNGIPQFQGGAPFDMQKLLPGGILQNVLQ